LNIFNSCDGKAEFSALLLHTSVSHDPSEIIWIWWFAQVIFQVTLLHQWKIYHQKFIQDT